MDKEAPDINEFMERAQELDNRLTEEERDAVWRYSDEYGSRVMAWYLNDTIQDHHLITRDVAMEQISQLDSFISKSVSAQQDRTLWRGIKKYYGDLTDLQVGETLNIKSFASASTDLEIAKDFVTKEAPILFKMKTKKGAPLKAYFLGV